MIRAPRECVGGCGRIVRPSGTRKSDYPTKTVAERQSGKCASCVRRESAGEPPGVKVYQRPAVCIGCGCPLRSSHGRKKPTDPPESRRYAGRGMCPTCYKHARRKEPPKPPPPKRAPEPQPVPIAATAAAHARYMAARKARLERAARTLTR